MLFTIGTTPNGAFPATDLGRLLHKHPAKVQSFELPFGKAVVFYPQAGDAACTAALHVDVDEAARMANGRERGNADTAYVSDRSYAAGSYLPSAMMKVFGTALGGRCESRQELAGTAIPLKVTVTPVACRGRLSAVDLFSPLGWTVTEMRLPLDPAFPAWGDAPHRRLSMEGVMRLSDALRHACLLLPVLDGQKHYFVADSEVEKLLRLGDGWLDGHPFRHAIVRRYLRNAKSLVSMAEGVLGEAREAAPDDAPSEPEENSVAGVDGAAAEAPPAGMDPKCDGRMGLQEARVAAAMDRLAAAGARSVADIGCGEGDLVEALCRDPRFSSVIGVDPSPVVLAKAGRRLERLQSSWRAKATLLQGAATYPDARLSGCDAYALLEVIEHVDPWRLDLLEEAVFGARGPTAIVVTTPNREFNAVFGMPEGNLRHRDHRFEFTRAEFHDWADGIGRRRGWTFETFGIGPAVEEAGAPTQGAVFKRASAPT